MIRPNKFIAQGTLLAALLMAGTATAEVHQGRFPGFTNRPPAGYGIPTLPPFERTWSFDIPLGDTVMPATVTMALEADRTLSGTISAAGFTRSFTGKIGRNGRLQARLGNGGWIRGKVQNGIFSGRISWHEFGVKFSGPLPPLAWDTLIEPDSSSGDFRESVTGVISYRPPSSHEFSGGSSESYRGQLDSRSSGSVSVSTTRILPPTRF